MIEDKHVHTGRFRQFDGFHVLRAAVDDDHRLKAVGNDAAHTVRVQAVALDAAVGDVIDDFGRAAFLRQLKRQHGGGNAVHVVIAVDKNFFAGHGGRPQRARGRRGTPHVERVELGAQPRRIKQLPALRLLGHAAVEHGRRQLGALQPAGQIARFFPGLVDVQVLQRMHRYQR